MKSSTLLKFSVAALALGSYSLSFAGGSFKEVSKRLDLDGDFVGYIDFDGDGQVLGEKLNVLYQQMAQVNPEVPPFPLDFPALFETLGFGSIRSMGMSSTEVEDGLFRNRSVTLLEGEPVGLLGLYGLDPIAFRAAELAPADATTVMSGRFDFSAVVSTAKALAKQVMGPMGEGMLLQGLGQPVPGTDITVGEAVQALSGGMDMIMSQNFETVGKPEIKVWLSLKGAGTLIPRLEPLFAQMGVSFVETETGRVADLSALLKGGPFGLFVESPNGSDSLVVYTDAEWVATFGGKSRLVDTANFKRVAGKLQKGAAFYAYSSGFEKEQLVKMLEGNPEVAKYAPLVSNAVDTLFGGFLAPSASATYREGDALISEGYAGFSYKGVVMALPAGIGAGVGASIAAKNAAESRGKSRKHKAEESTDDAVEAEE